ncbi:MAG: glutamine-hydrolyzing carbamoyl-phosphate synthase small subunit [Methanocellales archaeon]|nr:glutamine-hydrolyzing carbamoyl-phosphate synthase small subunit [Methanocellales archaeon]
MLLLFIMTGMLEALLVLEDGTVIRGKGFGSVGEVVGEVVFNTSMMGYTEILTDPSNKGLIVLFTSPSIGNCAVPPAFESETIQAEGVIVKEACKEPHHWQSDKTLAKWFEENGVPGIEGIDTRQLTRKITKDKTMSAVLSVYKEEPDISELIERACQFDLSKIDLVSQVSTHRSKYFDVGGKHTVSLLDCGIRKSLVRELNQRSINVMVKPPSSSTKEIMEADPDALMISGGPGDPSILSYAIETIRELMHEIPIFGMGIGYQIIALASGAKIFKMRFGHRGNQPVKDIESGRIHITSQNHGYAIDASSLDEGLKVTKINANDRTVEGISHKELPIMAVQYHPEVGFDNKYLFDKFVGLMEEYA